MTDRAHLRSPDPEILDQLRDIPGPKFEQYADLQGWSQEYQENVIWWIRHGWRYRERPVDVQTFLFGPIHMRAVDEMGKPVIWPVIAKAVEDICTGKYVECVLTGAIGSGKSTVALYVQAYMVYQLLCQKNPHSVYGLDPSSEIMMIFQSLKKELAVGVDYDRFRAMLTRAPIFADPFFAFDREIKSEMRFPNRIIVKPVAGLESGALGQNIVGGMLEEISSMAVVAKSRRARGKEVYDQAVTLYNSIARRRESRFMDMGEVPGMLCLVGSRMYQDDLLHEKLAEARDRPEKIYVYDKRVWEVKPWSYGTERFKVFVGDDVRKPRLLKEGEVPRPEEDHLVVEVPIELRYGFERDLEGSLRDVAGVSTSSIHPYIMDREKLARAFGRVKSCVNRQDTDFDRMRLKVYPRRWEGTEDLPRFAHLDLSLLHDSAGLAIGHCPGFRRIKRSDMVEEIWPVVQFDLILEIVPPGGGEINFERIRRLLYLLRERGMPIKWITADSYQSSDMLQILAAKGFIVGEESTDKTPAPYGMLKSGIYDGRVLAPEHIKAHKELRQLERGDRGKIDHPPVGGSKDCADSMACVVFGLSLQTEIWSQFGIELSHVPDSLEDAADEASTKREVEGKVR